MRDRAGLGGAIGFLLLALAFLAAPLWANEVAHTGPAENHITERITIDGAPTDVVALSGIPIGPTWGPSFFLGADENGRDLMVRLLYGGRTSLLIAGGALLITVGLAVPLALLAGYFRGGVDGVISRGLDLIWSFPALLLGVLLGTALSLGGARLGPLEIEAGSKLIPILIIGVVYVPYLARPLRGQLLSLRERHFVEAAQSSGAGGLVVMRSEFLPHLGPSILVLSTLLVTNAIVLEAALSFLGAGVPPPEPSLGVLISAGLGNVSSSPHLLLVPCAALTLIVLSLSFLAEGLRRALDPRAEIVVDPGRGQ